MRFKMTRMLVFAALLLQALLLYFYREIFFEKQTHTVFSFKREMSADWGSLDAPSDSVVNWKRIKNTKMLPAEVDWNLVKRKEAPPIEEMHERWIVITTINSPTEDVKKLANIEGWRVVVVGDTKTPTDWSHPNCVYLSIERQKTLGYRIVDLLPYKSYSRKNVGYMYAIQHGAKYIYETDDDNSPPSGKITFYEQPTGEFHVYSTDKLTVNPYAHFGQGTIWPRGYPLKDISKPNVHTFLKCLNVEPSIQQGVVDGDPDVDAIFRLTRKDQDVRLNVKFDASAPVVLLPPHTMAPFNTQNTFFLRKGFWALLIPTTVSFRVCDIWRGYWAQRMLWEVNGYLSFFPPDAVQIRSYHDFLLDFIDEEDLYYKSGKLVKFLNEWKSEKKDFFSRVLDLSLAMVEAGFWGTGDALLTEAWLHDLISIGYEPPELDPTPLRCSGGEEVTVLPKEQPSAYLKAGEKLVDVTKS